MVSFLCNGNPPPGPFDRTLIILGDFLATKDDKMPPSRSASIILTSDLESPLQRILVLLNDKWYLGTMIMATEVIIATKLSLLLSLSSRQELKYVYTFLERKQ